MSPMAVPAAAAAAAADLGPGEAERWDRFVAATPGGDVVQTAAWARAKRALGFETCHVRLGPAEAPAGGALIVIRRFGPLGAVGFVARGPLLRAGDERTFEMIDEIERAARARAVRHLIVQPAGERTAAALTERGYTADAPEVAPSATFRIDLAPEPERILAHMSSSKRYEIRRGLREGVEVRQGDDLQRFYDLYCASAARQGFAPVSKDYLRRHWDALHPRGYARLFFGIHGGRTYSGLYVSAFGETVTTRLSGWNGEGGRLQINAVLRWRALEWARDNGFRWFDLGGVERADAERIARGRASPDQLERSFGAFKREFGADVVLLPEAFQYTFNPVARFAFRTVYGSLARSASGHRLIHRLRSG